MADQICYSVLCVFSYVAAGTDKSKVKKPVAVTHLSLTTCLKPSSPSEKPAVPTSTAKTLPHPGPEPGSVTPIGGPPKYPPPALPPGVAPPAAPPGIKTIQSQLSLPSSKPPPVPSRTIPPRQMTIASQPPQLPPQPPPRPK